MKTGKRIVSKRQYAASIGQVTALSSLSIGFLLVGVITGLLALSLLTNVYNLTGMFWDDWGEGQIMTQIMTLFLGVASLLFLFSGAFAMHHIRKIDIGIPLTRSNTADLPAVDSLVRASQEPTDKQADVLVRPITDVQSTPPEQLLRSANDR